jgi:hypothetical protein
MYSAYNHKSGLTYLIGHRNCIQRSTISTTSSRNTKRWDKEMALKVLDTLLDKTKHNSYFENINFGSQQKFRHHKNLTLYLVLLMWLQHLQQCFFEKSEQDPLRDRNKYRRYYGTGTGFISGRPTLSNINMSTVKVRHVLLLQTCLTLSQTKREMTL